MTVRKYHAYKYNRHQFHHCLQLIHQYAPYKLNKLTHSPNTPNKILFFFHHNTQFISNAVEDMGIKRQQKEKAMLDDIFASTVMINKAKDLIGEL